MDVRDFDQLAACEGVQVEHQTIPGFLRRIPHKWHLDEITRFGDKVGRAAEAMQLSYFTAIDRSLGVIRVFPLPLLQRVYAIMAPQFHWPAVIEMESLEDGRRAQREALRKRERADKDLEDLLETADNVEVLTAVQAVRDFLASEMNRLRHEIEAPAPPPENLVTVQ